jgi:hypothetical protein
VRSEVVAPGDELLLGLDAERDVVHRPGADPALLEVRVLEAGHDRPRPTLLVTEEEVPRGAVVLADGLLDDPHPEQVAVEVDRPFQIPTDQGDVMQAREPEPVRHGRHANGNPGRRSVA